MLVYTGDSLNYAFVEFEGVEPCEEAYRKMNNVLIDDRRIRVDFSQSVSKEWGKHRMYKANTQKLSGARGGAKPAATAGKSAAAAVGAHAGKQQPTQGPRSSNGAAIAAHK
eukprot:17477-Heterococcus_DN1.PRE.2